MEKRLANDLAKVLVHFLLPTRLEKKLLQKSYRSHHDSKRTKTLNHCISCCTARIGHTFYVREEKKTHLPWRNLYIISLFQEAPGTLHHFPPRLLFVPMHPASPCPALLVSFLYLSLLFSFLPLLFSSFRPRPTCFSHFLLVRLLQLSPSSSSCLPLSFLLVWRLLRLTPPTIPRLPPPNQALTFELAGNPGWLR